MDGVALLWEGGEESGHSLSNDLKREITSPDELWGPRQERVQMVWGVVAAVGLGGEGGR